jgi:ribosome-associated toxin RatA of RatAB toxin-antitoxin module
MAAADRTEILEVPLKVLFETITDYASYPRFVNGMKTARVITGDTGEKKVEFDLEMVKRLQYIIKLNESLDEAAGKARVAWTLDSSTFFKVNNGSWDLKALGPDRTEATYKLELDFAFPVPGFMLKNLVKSALPSVIREFSEEARRRRKNG